MCGHWRFSALICFTIHSPDGAPPGEPVRSIRLALSQAVTVFHLFALRHAGLSLAATLALVVGAFEACLLLIVAFVSTGSLSACLAAVERDSSNRGYRENGCCKSQGN